MHAYAYTLIDNNASTNAYSAVFLLLDHYDQYSVVHVPSEP